MPKIHDRAPLSKFKKKSSSRRGSNPEAMRSEAIALHNEPRKHRLPSVQIYNILSVTITVNTSQACFRRFFAINSPRINVDLKQLALLK